MIHLNPVRCAVQGVLLALLLSTSQLYGASLSPAARGEIGGLLSEKMAGFDGSSFMEMWKKSQGKPGIPEK